MTGMSRSFIDAQMAEGTFPKQIHLGARTTVWNEREVVQWMEDRMASRWPRRVGDLNTNRTLQVHGQGTETVLCLFLCLKSSVVRNRLRHFPS